MIALGFSFNSPYTYLIYIFFWLWMKLQTIYRYRRGYYDVGMLFADDIQLVLVEDYRRES